VVTLDDVRAFANTLPRSSEAFVRGRVKFRIGRIVYLSLSLGGTVMGFAFPKEWRDLLVESEPQKFSLPSESDLRYHWVHVRLAAIDANEMRELVEDAWAFCVPRRVAEEYAAEPQRGEPQPSLDVLLAAIPAEPPSRYGPRRAPEPATNVRPNHRGFPLGRR
jgi:hypothetical protein